MSRTDRIYRQACRIGLRPAADETCYCRDHGRPNDPPTRELRHAPTEPSSSIAVPGSPARAQPPLPDVERLFLTHFHRDSAPLPRAGTAGGGGSHPLRRAPLPGGVRSRADLLRNLPATPSPASSFGSTGSTSTPSSQEPDRLTRESIPRRWSMLPAGRGVGCGSAQMAQ